MLLTQTRVKKLDGYNNSLGYSDELLSLGRGPILQNTNPKLVHELFENFSISNPIDIALTCGEISYTYKELNEWANTIAHQLLSEDIRSGKRVAILIEPSAAMIASVLGILKCGAAYVPLDNKQPTERIISLLSDAAVAGVVTNEHSIYEIQKLKIPIFNPGMIPEDIPIFDSYSMSTLPSASLEDPAYLIYTSGSTGEPKGVIIGHLALSNSTFARRLVYPGKSVFLLVSPLSFDSSVAGIWGTLSSGGQLVVASREESRDPEALLRLIMEHRVTKMLCIPSLYETVLDVIEKSISSQPIPLDTVIVAGETLHSSLLKRHFMLLGENVEMVNEYGPTEATVWATYHRFDSLGLVSIGKPIPGTYLYVLDEHLCPVPRGEVGELFIGGDQLAKGYFGRPEASDKVFLTDPFVTNTSARMYKTGDLVRWNHDETLEFIGRKDHQVKIRGHRVELSAIEAELQSFYEIREAVVISNNEGTTLEGFVLSQSKVSPENLRKKLALKLPSYMIPSKISVLEKFPLTSSGKVDRIALTNLNEKIQIPSLQPNQISEDDIEFTERVAAAWRELLNIDTVPENVNFFDLGGHSLMVFKLQEFLERYTGGRPPVVALFRHTTVSSQAEFIANQVGSAVQQQTSNSEVAA